MHLQDKEIIGSPIPESHIKTNKDLKVGDPNSRGMNNEEKKADKARKEGKTGDEANASKQGETSHGEFHAGDPKSRYEVPSLHMLVYNQSRFRRRCYGLDADDE